jgi:predicted transcriptional regulator
MNELRAIDAFSALSQETRRRIVHLLVQAGPDSFAVDAISEGVDISSRN